MVKILSLNGVPGFRFLVIASNCLLVVDVLSFARGDYLRYKHTRKLSKPRVL